MITIEESSFKIYRILKEKKFDLSFTFNGSSAVSRSDNANRSLEGEKKIDSFACKKRDEGSRCFRVFSRALLLYIYIDGSSRGPLPLPFTFMFYGQAVPRAPQKPTNSPTNAVALERNHFARFIYVVTIKRAPPSSNPWK